MKAAWGMALILWGGAAMAQQALVHSYEGSFEDAAFALENAIMDAGLVIDHISHTGDMLARTAADVGSDAVIFEAADVYQFCSAVVSRQVMEADPMNLMFCPYTIFVAERDGRVLIGHQSYPEGAMQAVQALLDGIVQEALAQ